jgi:hypothetical protein
LGFVQAPLLQIPEKTMGQSKPYSPEELARLRSGPFGRLRATLDGALAKKKAAVDGAKRTDLFPPELSS